MKLAVTGRNGEVGQRVVPRGFETGHKVGGVDIATEPRELHEVDYFIRKHASCNLVEADLLSYSWTVEPFQDCEAVICPSGLPIQLVFPSKTPNTYG